MWCRSILFALLLLGPAAAQTGRVISGIAYRTDVRPALALDLYLPPGPGPHPLALVMHGGGWHGGFRWYGEAVILAKALTREGIAVASVTYRLAPKHKFPAQIEDVRRALQFLRCHADYYRLDPERVAAVGASSGGHLAALLATQDDAAIPDSPDPVLRQSTRVRCVVGICAPLVFEPDPEEPVHPFAIKLLSSFVGVKPGEISNERMANEALRKVRAASPWHAATRDDPPFFLVAGGKDTLVPPSQSRRMARRLTEVDVPAEVIVLPEYGHCNFIAPIMLDWRQRQITWWDRTRLFLQKNLVGIGALDDRFAPRRPLAAASAELMGPASWSKDGRTLALLDGEVGRDLRLFEVESGRPPVTLRVPARADLAAPVFAPDGRRVHLMGQDAIFEVDFEAEAGTPRVKRKLPLADPVDDAGAATRRLTSDPQGRHLAFEAGGAAWLLRLEDGRRLRLAGPWAVPPRVFFDSRGRVVVTRFDGGRPRTELYEVDGRRRAKDGAPLLEVSGNGARQLVLGDALEDGQREMILRTGTERRIGRFAWKGRDPSSLRARWSADGRLLVIADEAGRLGVRDGMTAEVLQMLPEMSGVRARPIALRPNGRELLAPVMDGPSGVVPFLWRR